jgi:carbon monoxide dehydrogenase subunit G
MQVKMEKNFSVGASIQDVWNFMTNIEKVCTCVPGAQYSEDLGDDKHAVMLTVKVGPIKSSYRGEAIIRNMDANSHTIEIEGKGTDTKGKGGATMELVGKLTATDDQKTEVSGDSTVAIQGMLAQFGSRMIEDVSNQLFDQFTAALRGKLERDSLNTADKVMDASDQALSGLSVAGAAIKGAAGRLVDSVKKKTKK